MYHQLDFLFPSLCSLQTLSLIQGLIPLTYLLKQCMSKRCILSKKKKKVATIVDYNYAIIIQYIPDIRNMFCFESECTLISTELLLFPLAFVENAG